MAKQDFSIQGGIVQMADKSEPPILVPSIHEAFFPSIGALVIHWSLMEQQMNIALWALLHTTGITNQGWRGQGFDKRHRLFGDTWKAFAGDSDALVAFPNITHNQINSAKPLRDALAHKEMVLTFGKTSPAIRFYNKTRAAQLTRAYTLEHVNEAGRNVTQACGWFRWICQPDAAWPLPSLDISRLRSLPNTDHLRTPT